MNFKTHNDKHIDPTGTSYQGEISITYKELTECFGLAGSGDGHKVDAEWNIEFEDGTIATIYNWKNGRNYLGKEGYETTDICEWHVGGASPRSVELVKIAIDLHQESVSKPDNPLEKALEGADGMRKSILTVHGETYLQAVELGLIVRKQMEILAFVTRVALDGHDEFRQPADIIGRINSHMGAMTMAKFVRASKLDQVEGFDVNQLTGWVDRIAAAEQSGVEKMLEEMENKE